MDVSGPEEIVAALRAQGFVLSEAGGGDRLRVSPAARLTPPQRALLRAHKGAILERLRRDPEREGHEAGVRRRAPHDPRPDLDAAQRDAVWWSVLLELAAEVYRPAGSHGVYGALHASRCLGAGLARTPGGGLRLTPGAIPPAEWPAVRSECLAPHRTAVATLLRAVAVAAQALAEELAADQDALAAVRLVWPSARPLDPRELAEITALPVVDWRTLPRTVPAAAAREARDMNKGARA